LEVIGFGKKKKKIEKKKAKKTFGHLSCWIRKKKRRKCSKSFISIAAQLRYAILSLVETSLVVNAS
jgi:hypothetical protein